MMLQLVQAGHDTLAVMARTLPVIGLTLMVMALLSVCGALGRIQR